MARRTANKTREKGGLVKKAVGIISPRAGKILDAVSGNEGATTGKKRHKWTIEKGMKALAKAKIQGKINKAKYGWMK